MMIRPSLSSLKTAVASRCLLKEPANKQVAWRRQTCSPSSTLPTNENNILLPTDQ